MNAHRTILRDPVLDRALAEQGYCVTRVLDGESARRLRDEYGRLHGWERTEHSPQQPPDFEGDFWNEDLRYRRAISDAILAAAGPAVGALFTEGRLLGGSCLVRWPSAAHETDWSEVPNRFHSDTTFVDERRGARSHMVWIALQDITEGNGVLEVVPRSHQIDRGLRGVDFEAPWLQLSGAFEPRAIGVPLSAGEAIVFDPALVHRSGPNDSTEPRVTATCLIVTDDADLGFFRSVDEVTAERVPIEEDFFQTATMADIHARPGVERVPIAYEPLDEAQLSARLDVGPPG